MTLSFFARCVPALALLATLGVVTFLSASCGSDDSSDSSNDPSSTPTASPTAKTTATPLVTVTPDSISSGFWIGSSSLRVVSRYDSLGKVRTPIIDLKGALGPDGGITALKFVDSSNLLAFFDPGVSTKKEAILLIDAKKGTLKNRAWYTDDTELADVKTTNLITGFIPYTLLIPNGTKILRVLYDKALNASGSATTLLEATTLTSCPHTTIEHVNMITVNGTKYLLLSSSGANARVNVIGFSGGSPTCVASLNYAATGQPTDATHVAVNALHMADGKIYVLYQHATKSKIVRYTFDGKTFGSGSVLYSDQSILGAKPQGLAARSSQRILVGNTDDDKIFEISTSGAFTGFFVDNSFTEDITTIVTQ